MTIQLNIGTNMGDRPANLAAAVDMLVEAFRPASWRTSRIIASPPWGYGSENEFLNQGLRLDLDREMQPVEVLDMTQAVERAISPAPHRNPDGSYRDRIIDIDIITIDDIALSTRRLHLPHIHMRERPFVLIPYQELQ